MSEHESDPATPSRERGVRAHPRPSSGGSEHAPDPREGDPRTRTVRPRWVWAGLALAVLGLVLVAAGVVELSWGWAVVGVAALLGGAAVSAYGGVLADSRAGSPGHEVREVARGGTRQGRAPGADVHDPRAEAVSRESDETRRRLLAAAQSTGRPNLSPLGGGLALLTAAWLTVAQWSIYPMNAVGQSNALRDLGVALVVALAALRVLVAGPRLLASAVVAAGGVTLVLLGAFMPHHSTAVRVDELVCGVLVLAAALMAADRGGLRRRVAQTP